MSARNAATPATPPSSDMRTWSDGLEKILRAQIEHHEKLLACINGKRQAIRAAQIDAMRDISTQENAIMQRLMEFEKRRVDLIQHLSGLVNPGEKRTLTVSEIAADSRIDSAQRERMLALAAQLRDLLSEVKRESSIVRHAADALARHMSGIVLSVHSALNRTRVYSARGGLTPVGAVSVIDVKS